MYDRGLGGVDLLGQIAIPRKGGLNGDLERVYAKTKLLLEFWF